MSRELREKVRALVADEVTLGDAPNDGPERVALVYPSPYRTGMSSLGFLQIHRLIQSRGRVSERAFLPEDPDEYRRTNTSLFTFENERPVRSFPAVLLSVAYEIEIAGMIEVLELAGIPPLAKDRDERHPFILMGGPLTFSNPLPLAPYADTVLMGEADETIHDALDVIFAHVGSTRRAADWKTEAMRAMADKIPSAFVPELHGDTMPEIAKCAVELLPAFAAIRTPHTELRDMFLVEAERGCSRGCTYCVMRRSTNGGMRIVPLQQSTALIPWA